MSVNVCSVFVYLILADKSTLVATVELIIPDLKPKPSYIVGRVAVSRLDIELYSCRKDDLCWASHHVHKVNASSRGVLLCSANTLCGLHLGSYGV